MSTPIDQEERDAFNAFYAEITAAGARLAAVVRRKREARDVAIVLSSQIVSFGVKVMLEAGVNAATAEASCVGVVDIAYGRPPRQRG